MRLARRLARSLDGYLAGYLAGCLAGCFLACAAAFALLAGPGAPRADEAPAAPFSAAAAAAIAGPLRQEPALLRSFGTCPADTFARERPFWRWAFAPRRPTERRCARQPASCRALCTRWSNAPAGFDLALEHRSLDVADILDKERLYAFAGAGGFPAGCINRGAGIRDGDCAEGPVRAAPRADTEACRARSFRLDCDRRGAWGCAMLGQAYRLGAGAAAEASRARSASDVACAIKPDFAACTFAKRQLAEMGAL